MRLVSLKKDELPGFIEGLISTFEVYAPTPKEFKYTFQKVTSFREIALDYNMTMLPPKKLLTPQREVLFSYTTGKDPELTPELDTTKRVVFGAHSCDLSGIRLLDDVFSEGYPDPHYLARRGNTVLIGVDCKTPCHDRSFCKDMGTLKPTGGYDLFFTDLGDSYCAQVATKTGESLLELAPFQPVGYAVKDRFYETWRLKLEGFPNRIAYDTERLPNLLADAYDDLLWDALEERCFDCGACTVVCPTCYCFDVIDEVDVDLSKGVRLRRWDSCQLRDFAAVAGGANMRGKRSDRLRHRFFRKGKYFKEKFGRFACVGCGRCGRACLAHIDVMEVFNQVKQ